MFYSGLVYVDDLLHGGHSGKFTPIEVAQWLEAFTTIAEQSHAAAKKFSNPNGSIRRLEEDVLIQIALAEYSYPALIQMPDGTIMVSYTCRRQTIKVVSFQEDWIRHGQPSKGEFKGARFESVVMKPGACR